MLNGKNTQENSSIARKKKKSNLVLSLSLIGNILYFLIAYAFIRCGIFLKSYGDKLNFDGGSNPLLPIFTYGAFFMAIMICIQWYNFNFKPKKYNSKTGYF